MEATVISMADYKIKKQELATLYNWWIPTMHIYFIPPFFWGFIIV